MMHVGEEIEALVRGQLSSIRDPLVRQALVQILVSPQQHLRSWDYGSPGEQFPCWTIAFHDASDTSIVYSEHGFGPRCPWGLVFPGRLWFGMDSGWFPNLRDCFLNSFFAAGLPIWQVVREARSSRKQTIHRDLIMDEAFRRRDSMAQTADDEKLHVLPRPDELTG